MKKLVRKITAVVLAISLALGTTAAVMAAEPVRSTFESAGATVTWDGENHLILIQLEENTIVFAPGSGYALVNGQNVALESPVTIENDTAFISPEALAEIILLLTPATEDIVEEQPEETQEETAEEDEEEYEQEELSEHAVVVATMEAAAAQFSELAMVPNFSLAFVDVNEGFSWAGTTGGNIDADTIFHMGSIGKTFTAVAVMQLVEQGLLDLDMPIVYYLPEFSTLPSASGQGNYQNITARMLLSHTAGIYTNDMGNSFITYGGHNEDFMNNFLARFANMQMVREEGTEFEYANNGFVILGILVAHIAGHDNYFQGFNQFMLENVFLPMGLERTSYVVTPELAPYLAPVYTMAGMPRQFQYWNPLPTGTVFTTANESISLMTMFLNNGYYNGVQIITPESVDQMFTPQPNTGEFYGLGIAFMPDPSGASGMVLVGHNGGMIYNFAAMALDRELGIGAFSATNSTTSQGTNEFLAGTALATVMTQRGLEIPAPISHIDPDAYPVEISAEEMEALSGLFLLGGGMLYAIVEVVEDELFLRIPVQGANIQLTPMSDGHFASDLGIPFWLITDGEEVLFVQGANRYAVAGARVDASQFTPDEDFMENWNGFTFAAQPTTPYDVLFIPTMTFGVTEEGFAFGTPVIINTMPGSVVVFLESMDQDIVLEYEDGQHFFYYWGVRFVRQEG